MTTSICDVVVDRRRPHEGRIKREREEQRKMMKRNNMSYVHMEK
jgi:hypothetical protein